MPPHIQTFLGAFERLPPGRAKQSQRDLFECHTAVAFCSPRQKDSKKPGSGYCSSCTMQPRKAAATRWAEGVHFGLHFGLLLSNAMPS